MSAKLNYITLDQLLASVETDLYAYADNGMINRGSVIKTLRRVNEDLGLKINPEKEAVITITNHKGDLPLDFYKLQLAYICGQNKVYHTLGEVFGTVTEEFTEERVPVEVRNAGNACLNSCGECIWVTQLFKQKFIRYPELIKVRVTQRSRTNCTTDCPNLALTGCEFEIDIENGEVATGMKEGKLYISYLADMSDEHGNLLVLDHPLTRDYYEYAVKKALLEQWMINKDADVAQALIYIKEELRNAKAAALKFVTTVEYSEIEKVFKENRMAFRRRYMSQFDC